MITSPAHHLPCRLDPPRPPIRSPRAAEVARWFSLPPHAGPCGSASSGSSGSFPSALPLPTPGQILLITGPSGSGKSLLLTHCRTHLHAAAKRSEAGGQNPIDLHRIRLPDKPVIDCFGRLTLTDALRLLSQVGLAEAWTALRTPAELSEGQRWRLRLAIALAKAGRTRRQTVLLADEFAALLDRITARIVARVLRRSITRHPNLSAIVATSHDDLVEALAPDLHLRCDFGEVHLSHVTCQLSLARRLPDK